MPLSINRPGYAEVDAVCHPSPDHETWEWFMRDVMKMPPSMMPGVEYAVNRQVWRHAKDPVGHLRIAAENWDKRRVLKEKGCFGKVVISDALSTGRAGYAQIDAASCLTPDAEAWEPFMRDVVQLPLSMLPAIRYAVKAGRWKVAGDPIGQIRNFARNHDKRRTRSKKSEQETEPRTPRTVLDQVGTPKQQLCWIFSPNGGRDYGKA
jgi:hypothetical protein